MFEQDVSAGFDNSPADSNVSEVTRALTLYLLITISIVATSWLLAIPTYFDIKIAVQVLPVILCVAFYFLVTRLYHRFILNSVVPVLFLVIFSCWSFVFYLNISSIAQTTDTLTQTAGKLTAIADTMYLIGISLCIILLHRYFRFAVYLSLSSIITLLTLILVFSSPDISYLSAVIILFMTTTLVSFIAISKLPQTTGQKLITLKDHFHEDELLPSELGDEAIIPELAINALPLNEHSATHDWEETLRVLQTDLSATSDVDQTFKSMLMFLHDRVEFDAAAVGMLQERSIRKIAAMGDDAYLHSKSLGWTSQRIKQVLSTREPILSQQPNVAGSDATEHIHRVDIPVLTSRRALGVVTLFRETMIFDTQDVKMASSIVFHTMIALKQARLQDEIKRLSSGGNGPARLTLYSREQFVQKTQPVFDKLGKPRECSVFIIDVDNLSDINDKTGRDAATALYKAVSKTIMKELTDQDILGRYGKEGFIVLLDETDMNGAKEKAEAIRKRVSQLKLNYQSQVISTTVSIGLTIVSDPEDNLQALMRKCDMALFVAKENGCNTVKVSL